MKKVGTTPLTKGFFVLYYSRDGQKSVCALFPTPNGAITFTAFHFGKGEFFMKTVLKLLRLTGVDVLFLGLVEKLALGLIKKLTAIANRARSLLDRLQLSCDE